MPAKTTDKTEIPDEELATVADETARAARRVVAAFATDADEKLRRPVCVTRVRRLIVSQISAFYTAPVVDISKSRHGRPPRRGGVDQRFDRPGSIAAIGRI